MRTPENVELSYLLAGAGSRIAAYLIDILFLWLLLNLFQNLLLALLIPLSKLFEASEAWMIAILALVSFVLLNCYFIVFEWLMNGQTPGKRFVGIRVIKEGGYALRFVDTLIRNLMRVIDFLPFFYGVGLASLLLTSRSQRLGDLLAGTLMVHRQKIQTESAMPEIPLAEANRVDLPSDRVSAIPDEIINLVVQFFDILPELGPKHRQQLAVEIVDLIWRTSELKPDQTQSAEAFLGAVIRQSARTAAS